MQGEICPMKPRQDVRDAMDAFRSAAARRGAYAEQCEAAEAALQLLEPADTLLLEELQDSLQRLLTNVASSIKRRSLDARGPHKVVQKRLSSARSRAVRRLREACAAGSPVRALAPKPTTPAVAAHCPLLATLGPRHLCESYCYFREHEPTRRLHALRQQLAARGVPAEAAAAWRVEPRLRTPRPKRARRGQGEGEGEGGSGLEGGGGGGGREAAAAAEWGVVFVSGAGIEYATQEAALRAAVAAAAAASAPATAAASAPAAAASCAGPAGDAGGATRGGSASASSPSPAAARAACASSASSAPASSAPASSASSALAWSPLAQRSRFFRAPPPAAPPTTAAPPAEAEWRAGATQWRPPRSPLGLLEELLWDRPWALVVCCILLNQTSRVQVDPVLCRLLRQMPDAAALASAEPAQLEALLRPLGLHRRRAQTLIDMSRAFLGGSWRRVEELPGVGKYAADAYAIFCLGRWREVAPSDHALNAYHEWLGSIAA